MTKDAISPLATVKSTQITDSQVDEAAVINEKTSIKATHIGPASTIESKTRISDSIIMRNVTIKQR